MSFQIKQNDTTPSLRASLLNGNGDAVDLINTTVKFHMRPIGSSTPSIDAVASVISEPLGVVQYDWLAGDTSDIGSYQAEFEVTYPAGGIETFPNDGYIRIEVIDDITQGNKMEIGALWSVCLTAGLGLLSWLLRSAYAEVQRISILLNKTREEMAREYVTKTDSTAVMAQIVARFDRIEEKIDRLMER